MYVNVDGGDCTANDMLEVYIRGGFGNDLAAGSDEMSFWAKAMTP